MHLKSSVVNIMGKQAAFYKNFEGEKICIFKLNLNEWQVWLRCFKCYEAKTCC